MFTLIKREIEDSILFYLLAVLLAALEVPILLIPTFSEEGALELEVLTHSADTYDFNVTRCRYAEFYEEMGANELGLILSCSRDFALAGGISNRLELIRTQTIMQGASHCDFRLRLKR